MKKKQLRILSYTVMVYMLLAFSWWSVLLLKKNKEAFNYKAWYTELQMEKAGKLPIDGDFEKTPDYQLIKEEFDGQRNMIIGEGVVFVITIVVGIWLVNNAYHRQMIAANQRRNFLLSITHELKSPIASIKLVLETFRKRKGLSEKQTDKLCQNGLEEADRLHQLVNDLLLGAKMEKSYRPNRQSIQLEPFFKKLIQQFTSFQKNASINLNVAANMSPISFDKQGLEAVTTNLLSNAVKYSTGIAQIDLIVYEENSKVFIEFRDQGIGIPDDEKKRIFQKFYRIGNEDTRKTKGTGLGLYIVDEIVKAHGGAIQVMDNQPTGTIFQLQLPTNQLATRKTTKSTKPKETLTKEIENI